MITLDNEKGKRRLKLLLVGSGRQATSILHTSVGLLNEIEVVGCCDLDESRAAFTARRFGLKEYYTDLDEALKKVKADAALVVTFPGIQHQLTLKCLEAGLNVYSEKPIASELEHAYKILDTAEKKNIIYRVGFNKRFAPAYVSAKNAINSLAFGKPSMLYAKFAGGYRPATRDLLRVGAIHMFDMSRFLIGEVKELFAYMYEKEQGKSSFSVSLKFDNGCVGVYVLSSLGLWSAKGTEFIEARGDQNIFWVDSSRETKWQKPPLAIESGITTQSFKETPSPAEYYEPNYSDIGYVEMQSFYLNGFFQSVKAFANSVMDNVKNPVPNAVDGIKALKIAIAIEESVKSGKPITLD